MYVCICHKVTEEELKKTVESSSNIKDCLKRLNIGGSCGVCLVDALKNLGVEYSSEMKVTEVKKN